MESAWVQDATLHLLQWETKGENENLASVLKTNGKKKKIINFKGNIWNYEPIPFE